MCSSGKFTDDGSDNFIDGGSNFLERQTTKMSLCVFFFPKRLSHYLMIFVFLLCTQIKCKVRVHDIF